MVDPPDEIIEFRQLPDGRRDERTIRNRQRHFRTGPDAYGFDDCLRQAQCEVVNSTKRSVGCY